MTLLPCNPAATQARRSSALASMERGVMIPEALRNRHSIALDEEALNPTILERPRRELRTCRANVNRAAPCSGPTAAIAGTSSRQRSNLIDSGCRTGIPGGDLSRSESHRPPGCGATDGSAQATRRRPEYRRTATRQHWRSCIGRPCHRSNRLPNFRDLESHMVLLTAKAIL
jgi:hypothetical protein